MVNPFASVQLQKAEKLIRPDTTLWFHLINTLIERQKYKQQATLNLITYVTHKIKKVLEQAK